MAKVSLKKPLKMGDELIDVLTIQEPRAIDLDGVDLRDLTNATVMRKLISRLSGTPDKVIQKMSAKDFIVCMEVVSSFLDDSQATTKTGKESLRMSSTSSHPN